MGRDFVRDLHRYISGSLTEMGANVLRPRFDGRISSNGHAALCVRFSDALRRRISSALPAGRGLLNFEEVSSRLVLARVSAKLRTLGAGLFGDSFGVSGFGETADPQHWRGVRGLWPSALYRRWCGFIRAGLLSWCCSRAVLQVPGWHHSWNLSSAPACAKAVAQQVQKSNLRARSYFPGASAQTQHWRGFAGFWRRSYGRQNCCETCCGMRGKVRGNLFGNSGLSSELFLLPTSRSPASARVCRLSSSEVSPPCCSETRSEMLSICVPICVLKTVPPGQELSIGAACGVIWCVPTGIDWTAPAACKRAFCCLPADGRFDCYTPCYSPGVTALTMRSPWGCRPRQCWVPALTMARSPCGHHGPGSSASTGFPRSRSAPDVRPLGPLDDACRTARAVADIAIAVGPE